MQGLKPFKDMSTKDEFREEYRKAVRALELDTIAAIEENPEPAVGDTEQVAYAKKALRIRRQLRNPHDCWDETGARHRV